MTDYRITSLNSSGAHRVYPDAINDQGLIVGYTQDYRQAGFLNDTRTHVVTSLDPTQDTATFPGGLNENGQVVGYYKDRSGVHGFELDVATGEKTTIDAAGSMTILRGINNAGLVYGDYLDKNQNEHSFVDDTRTGTITPIVYPGSTATFATGLNNAGEVVGVFHDNAGHAHGFVDDTINHTIRSIDVPGATDTYLAAVNDKGLVVGTYIDGSGRHGYVDDTATNVIEHFEVAGSLNLGAYSVNEAGLVVGSYDVPLEGNKSYTYDSKTGVFAVLDVMGSNDVEAYGINNQGQIIGTFEDNNGLHGFVADPISDPPCYCPGTLIRTPDGDRPIETIAIGDVLVTASGRHRPVRWVGRTSYDVRSVGRNPDILPICIKAGALDRNIPRRDLWVSPGHAFYFDGVLVHAAALVNGVSILQAEAVDSLSYVHVELDDHDILVAEGAEAESFLDNGCRRQFSNADDFHRRYPQAIPGHPCFPILEDGFHLQAIRRRIDARAGLEAGVGSAPGSLRGFVDVIGPDRIRGWAQDQSQPEVPVCLDVLIDGARVLRMLANRRRLDLRKAGLGSGRHAFEARLPDGVGGRVEVRRSVDQTKLALTANARIGMNAVQN